MACCAWSVLLQAQDEWHYLLYSYYRSLPFQQRWYGVMPFIMLDIRLIFFFPFSLSNTFSPAGRWQSAPLLHFSNILDTFIFVFCFPGNSRCRRSCLCHFGVKKYWAARNVEHPVGMDLNSCKRTCQKSINKLAVRALDSWTAWRLCLLEDYCKWPQEIL